MILSQGKKGIAVEFIKSFLLAPWVLQDEWDRVVLQLRKGSHVQNRAQNQSRWINGTNQRNMMYFSFRGLNMCVPASCLTSSQSDAQSVQMQSKYMCIHYMSVYMNKQLKVLVCPPAAEMEDEVSDAMLKEVCITEQTQYYFETNQLSFRGNIDCENCTRSEYPPLLGFTAGV